MVARRGDVNGGDGGGGGGGDGGHDDSWLRDGAT